MSWKDQYRDRKEASGLTWDEFVDQRLVHVDDIADSKLDDLTEHLEAVRNEYRDLKCEVFEVRKLAESDEYDL
jgi:hypothetical protein